MTFGQRLEAFREEKLSTLFSVSTDYLLGCADDRQLDLTKYEMHAHRKDGVGADLPEEAQEELRKYVELLKLKYGKR